MIRITILIRDLSISNMIVRIGILMGQDYTSMQGKEWMRKEGRKEGHCHSRQISKWAANLSPVRMSVPLDGGGQSEGGGGGKGWDLRPLLAFNDWTQLHGTQGRSDAVEVGRLLTFWENTVLDTLSCEKSLYHHDSPFISIREEHFVDISFTISACQRWATNNV